VFTSPESLLGNGRWTSMLSSDINKKNLIGIVVDEAHCISHRLALFLLLKRSFWPAQATFV